MQGLISHLGAYGESAQYYDQAANALEHAQSRYEQERQFVRKDGWIDELIGPPTAIQSRSEPVLKRLPPEGLALTTLDLVAGDQFQSGLSTYRK
jgi:hypothetical protein